MYRVKSQQLNPGETYFFSFDIHHPIREGAIWVRAGDVIGTAMNYVVELLFSQESQELRNRTVSSIDVFRFDLFPANRTTINENFPIELLLRVQNNDTKSHVFYCAIVAKGLEEIG